MHQGKSPIKLKTLEGMVQDIEKHGGKHTVQSLRTAFDGFNAEALDPSVMKRYNAVSHFLQAREAASQSPARDLKCTFDTAADGSSGSKAKKIMKTGLKITTTGLVATATVGAGVVAEKAYGAPGLYGTGGTMVAIGGSYLAYSVATVGAIVSGPVALSVGALAGGGWLIADGLLSENHKPAMTRNAIGAAPKVLELMDAGAHKMPDSSTFSGLGKYMPDSSTFSSLGKYMPDSSTFSGLEQYVPDSSTFSGLGQYVPDSSKFSSLGKYMPDSSTFGKFSNSTAYNATIDYVIGHPYQTAAGAGTLAVGGLAVGTQTGRAVSTKVLYSTMVLATFAVGTAVATAATVPAVAAGGVYGISYAAYAAGALVLATGGTIAWKVGKHAFGSYKAAWLAAHTPSIAMPLGVKAGVLGVAAGAGAGVATSGALTLADTGVSQYQTGKAELAMTTQALDMLPEQYQVRETLEDFGKNNPGAVLCSTGVVAVGTAGALAAPTVVTAVKGLTMSKVKTAIGTPIYYGGKVLVGGSQFKGYTFRVIPTLTGMVGVDVAVAHFTFGNYNKSYTVSWGKGVWYAGVDVYNNETKLPNEGFKFETVYGFVNRVAGQKLFSTTYTDGVRKQYNDNIEELRDSVESDIEGGRKIDQAFCVEVSNEREAIKDASQLDTPFLGRVSIYGRQIQEYNHHKGMLLEEIEANCASNTKAQLFSVLKTDDSEFYNKQFAVAEATGFKVNPFDVTEMQIACMGTELTHDHAVACEVISA